ncbi:MAG TPA: 2-phospho-L-lactate guanylyltransferase [Xanthobacteraceae bacterium]
MPTALLIPVKNLSHAKQRLGEAFDQHHRSLLAEAMLRDVLTAAAGVADRLDLYLVTDDAQARRLRAEFGFGVIEDTRNQSETAAMEMATAWSEEHGYDTTVVLPGDVPLTTSAELHRVLDSAPEEGAVFVPAYDRRGSNCILRRPASIIPLRFGDDSFLPHCEAMKKIGKPLVILELPGIGLDIDHPHELELLARRAGNTHAQRLLRSWGVGSENRAALEAAG